MNRCSKPGGGRAASGLLRPYEKPGERTMRQLVSQTTMKAQEGDMTGLILAASMAMTYCQNIRDSDLRNYCKGRFGQSSYCSQIKRSDLRNKCRALTSRQKSYCMAIKDSNLRNECRAAVAATH